MNPTLSVVINTKNAVRTLEACLQSVRFADEIIVADMKSTDQTLAIATQAGAKIIPVPESKYVEPARNEAIAAARSDWILIVDADETVSETLATTIRTLLTKKGVDAYQLPRKNLIFGQWVRHTGWWPDYQLRLFRAGVVHWPSEIHSVPVVDGVTESLAASAENALVHDNYPSVHSFIERLNRYTDIQAETALDTSELITQQRLIHTLTDEFVSRYCAQNGYRDGVVGLYLSWMQAGAEATHRLKIAERTHQLKKTSTSQRSELSYLIGSLKYWSASIELERSRGIARLFWRVRRAIARRLYL